MELNDKIVLLQKIMRTKERIAESLARNGKNNESLVYQHEMMALKTAIDILLDNEFAELVNQGYVEDEKFDKYWASDGYDM